MLKNEDRLRTSCAPAEEGRVREMKNEESNRFSPLCYTILMKELLMKLIMSICLFVLLTTLSFADDIITISGGKKIVLHDNYTWEYSNESVISDTDIIQLTLNTKAKKILKNKTGKYQVNIDSDIWTQTYDINDNAEFQFINKEQTGFSVILYDGLPIPLDAMEKILIVNANNVDPNAAIKSVEKCIVNGTEGELVTYLASSSVLEFTFIAFIASKETGTIQYTFYTPSSYFDKLKPQFLEAISGLAF